MKKSKNLLVGVILSVCLLSCSDAFEGSESKVRFANFLISSSSLEFELISEVDSSTINARLAYKQAGNYIQVPTGRYQLIVRSQGKMILSRSWVAGFNDPFTIAAIGMLPEHPELNEETRYNRLLEIFEGSVEESSNGGLPKIAVYLDHFEDKPSKGELKIVHLVPGFTNIEVHVKKRNKLQHSIKLAYPQKSSSFPLDPGSYTLEMEHSSSGIHLGRKKIEVKPKVLTSAFIVGYSENYPDSLDCVLLKN